MMIFIVAMFILIMVLGIVGTMNRKKYKHIKSTSEENNVTYTKENFDQLNSLDDDFLNILLQKETNELSNEIAMKMSKNIKLDEMRAKLIRQDYKKFLKIENEPYPGYYSTYVEGSSAEKEGELFKAAKIYWFNIYKNGTIAPGNFSRLLIILRKLKLYNHELVVAKIFISMPFDNIERDKIKTRINTIKKLISKQNTGN